MLEGKFWDVLEVGGILFLLYFFLATIAPNMTMNFYGFFIEASMGGLEAAIGAVLPLFFLGFFSLVSIFAVSRAYSLCRFKNVRGKNE